MYSLNTDFLNRIQPHLRICKSNLSPFLPPSFLSFFFWFCFLLSNELLFWRYQKYEGRSIPLKEFESKLRFLSLKTVLAQQHKPGFRVRRPGYGALPVIYILSLSRLGACLCDLGSHPSWLSSSSTLPCVRISPWGSTQAGTLVMLALLPSCLSFY